MDTNGSPEGQRMLKEVSEALAGSTHEEPTSGLPPETVHWVWPRKPVGPSKGAKGFKVGKAAMHGHAPRRAGKSRAKKNYGWD